MVIWLPETVKVTLPVEASALVASSPTIALCITPALSATTPPVALPGMSPTRIHESAVPPEIDIVPVAARIVVPVAGTVAAAPVAAPPYASASAERGVRVRLIRTVTEVSASKFLSSMLDSFQPVSRFDEL